MGKINHRKGELLLGRISETSLSQNPPPPSILASKDHYRDKNKKLPRKSIQSQSTNTLMQLCEKLQNTSKLIKGISANPTRNRMNILQTQIPRRIPQTSHRAPKMKAKAKKTPDPQKHTPPPETDSLQYKKLLSLPLRNRCSPTHKKASSALAHVLKKHHTFARRMKCLPKPAP